MAAQPTLLIFTLGADRERRRRRLLPAGAAAVERDLHAGCLAEVLSSGAAAGCLPVVCAPSGTVTPGAARTIAQGSGSFGARLGAALAALGPVAGEDASAPVSPLPAGAPVLVVGTDTPGLSPGLLRDALSRLAADPRQVVLGPSPDGGIYLLAARVPLAPLLAGVRWCSRRTRASLCAALRAAGLVPTLLRPLGDLDRRADLEAWLARGEGGALLAAVRRRISALLATLCRPLLAPLLAPPAVVCPVALPARAPPPRRRHGG